MNVEFHYYCIYYLAREAGLTEGFAGTLAAASQFVDSSTAPLAFDAPRGPVGITVTQNYVFWDEAVRRDIYLPFHFLPGDPEPELIRSGRSNPYAVTANGSLAKALMIQAFKERDPYLMGIAVHTLADTWAHQHFSGQQEDWNRLNQTAAGPGLPPAGHLQALTAPDEPGRVWTDSRLPATETRIDNIQRFRDAARKIYRYLCVFMGKAFHDEELVLDTLVRLWSNPSAEGRLVDYTIEWDIAPWDPNLWPAQAGARITVSWLASVKHYDKLAWAKGELLRALGESPHPHSVGTGFYDSHLYHWHQAAIEHRSRAQAAIKRRGLS
jgi:hypothetical protein